MTDLISRAVDWHIIVMCYIVAFTCGRAIQWMKNNP